MATLTYWVAKCLDDSDAYSIRRPTRKACRAAREAQGEEKFAEPKKVVVEYDNSMDLVQQCLGEGRAYWEA